jgi:toxin CcdB
MLQFDVIPNPNAAKRKARPFLVVLQDNRFAALSTLVVAPCAPVQGRSAGGVLTPEVAIKGARYLLVVPELAAIPLSALGKPVGNLESQRYDILRAVDFLFTGT